MKKKRGISTVKRLLTTAILFIPFVVLASDPVFEFKRANDLYQKQSYEAAAKIYEQLISQDYRLMEIYYNLGNCYYKNGYTAKAILNYERALKYKPDDEDILFNLKIAQLKTVDKIEALPEIFYVHWIRSAASLFSADEWGVFLTLGAWLLFICAAVYAFSQRSILRKAALFFATLCLTFSLVSGFLARQIYFSNNISQNAVIMSVSVYVKSSPGDNNTDLFLLHEGTRINILDDYENWIKIKIANGGEGWIKRSEVEII